MLVEWLAAGDGQIPALEMWKLRSLRHKSAKAIAENPDGDIGHRKPVSCQKRGFGKLRVKYLDRCSACRLRSRYGFVISHFDRSANEPPEGIAEGRPEHR